MGVWGDVGLFVFVLSIHESACVVCWYQRTCVGSLECVIPCLRSCVCAYSQITLQCKQESTIDLLYILVRPISPMHLDEIVVH